MSNDKPSVSISNARDLETGQMKAALSFTHDGKEEKVIIGEAWGKAIANLISERDALWNENKDLANVLEDFQRIVATHENDNFRLGKARESHALYMLMRELTCVVLRFNARRP